MADSVAVDRYWFLTWTAYGTWLPGDDRGFVGEAPDESGRVFNHNVIGTPRLRRINHCEKPLNEL